MSSHSSNTSSSAAFVQKLVCYVLQQPAEAVKSEYRTSLQLLNCSSSKYDCDEFSICEKIKKKFMKENRVKEALTFVELLRKVQSSSILKNRASVLNFLYCLYGFDSGKKKGHANLSNLLTLDSGLKHHDFSNKHINKSLANTVNLSDFYLTSQNDSTEVQFSKCTSKSSHKKSSESKHAKSKVDKLSHQDEKTSSTSEKALSTRSTETNLGSVCYSLPILKLLLRDLMFAFQGLKGDIIDWDPEKQNFNVEFKEELPNPVKNISLRFIELGWMYCRINQFCIAQSNEKSQGLIVQSFVAVLKSKLVDYYKLIAALEASLLQETTLESVYGNSNSLTLHRLSVWILEPHFQLKLLAAVVDACKGKKGGALASVLYSHLHHGDNFVRSLIQSLLQEVTRPLFRMLSNWIYYGELDDFFGEFFVVTNENVPDLNLWQEKYSLNKAMIPSFISMEQARKILSTGKAINFLHRVCQDKSFTQDKDRQVKALELMSTESLFSQEKDANLENILEKNYLKTSKAVLQVLHDKYFLMDHLMAMRNYFLLGQGDFIRHLMDLFYKDLTKPGVKLKNSNMTGMLETAIRATNAQFHNPEILQRLDIKLLEVTGDDTGWDVFNLDYHSYGPIGTLFTASCRYEYSRLFAVLWKAKRMEYILSKISHSRTTYLKLQNQVPFVTPVLYLSHIILAQMVHFVQQMQYYMAFEVMECCWADLLLKISSARDLDQVIAAHENFLENLLIRALLDTKSRDINGKLNAVYTVIIEFGELQNKFWKEVQVAVDALKEMDDLIEANTNKDCWGITEKEKKKYMEPLNDLKSSVVPVVKAKLKILSNTYEKAVLKFLMELNGSEDSNLHFLSFRLDFNEHFKNKNSELDTSLTYKYRRQSMPMN